uniref:Exocyst component Exo84 C-terminal domain-containing protein n=2 Tax=Oryza brachyantha TaxID=4533 RepID=J3MVG1_ORYBR
MFEEAGGDKEKDAINDLKQHAMAQKKLIQDVRNSLYYSSAVALDELGDSDAIATDGEDDIINPTASSSLSLLDDLLLEKRMEQAVEILEQELQRMQESDVVAAASRMSAVLARKASVADRLASVAEHPRTPRPELLRALTGLCRLGEKRRANGLLLGFYRASVRRRVDESLRLKQPGNGKHSYLMHIVRTVLSTVVEASRSAALLQLQPSAEMERWAREEMEDLGVAIREFIFMAAAPSSKLALTLEAARCALDYVPLLDRHQAEYLREVLAQCMEEALAMYAGHLREVIRLLASDGASMVLGRFLVSGVLRTRKHPEMEELSCCLLTTSGRKVATLMQDVVEDVSPLLGLGTGMTSLSLLQLLAELLREYMLQLLAVAAAAANDDMTMVSVLINCTTLLSLFPLVARRIFTATSAAASQQEDFDFPPSQAFDGLILSIKEAAGQVWTCFCHHFIRHTVVMSSNPLLHIRSNSTHAFDAIMPSSAFQVFFLRVRQLNGTYGAILTGEDGTMKKLLQELMEAMMLCLSDNLDSWIHQASHVVPQDTLLQQIQLDVHFLLEVAQFGGFSSDDFRNAALCLLRKAQELAPSCSLEQQQEEGWAADAARHAVQVLMGSQAQQNSCSTVSLQEGEAGDETQPDASSQHQVGACSDGKSSDEFVSLEDEALVDSAEEDSSCSQDGGPVSPTSAPMMAVASRQQLASTTTTPAAAANQKGNSRRKEAREGKGMVSSRPRWH